MSTFAAIRGRREGEIGTAFESSAPSAAGGQRHDRILDETMPHGPPVSYASGRDDSGNIEITAGQKMLSAMSGSLLTSLIGIAHPSSSYCVMADTAYSYTS